MKVLVTGSAGKVGRAAVKAMMRKGHEVRATDVLPPVFERPEPDDPEYIQADVSTVCLGMGMSAGAMILCGGAAGKRYALPNAKLMIHQGSAGFRGTPADIQIQAREVLETMQRMAEVIARHSGRSVDEVLQDIDRDRFLTAQEGVDYRLIDEVMAPTLAHMPRS